MPTLSNHPVNLLVSARDPGAASNMREIAIRASERNDVNVMLAASGPAYDHLTRAGLEVIEFPNITIDSSDDEHLPKLLHETTTLVEQTKPDAILTGLSGPQAGIDEALLKISDISHTYTLQEYWGDINNMLDSLANTYFVRDQLAKELTRIDATIIPVGSPRYAYYETLEIEHLRSDLRDNLNLTDDDLVIGFFGQPVPERNGYHRTVKAFSDAIAALKPKAHVIFRPHPKETNEDIQQITALFEKNNLNLRLDDYPCAERLICGCDILASLFSTCALDNAYLNRYSSAPLGVGLLLFFDQAIRDLRKDHCGIDYIPIAKEGMAISIDHPDQLTAFLKSDIEEHKKNIWLQSKTLLSDPSSSADMILDIIVHDVTHSEKVSPGNPPKHSD